MNTDAYYEIGSSHRVCEDYALAGQYEDMAYALVSDGCSSSDDSDVGARLLSHIAKGVLIYLKGRNLIGSVSFPDIFRELVVRKGIEVKQSLGLPTDVFDATLLVCTVYNNKVTCLGWGDGYLMMVTDDNSIIAYEIKYSSGAPYYISYEMSPGKKEAYWQTYGGGMVDIRNSIISPEGDLIYSNTNVSPVSDSYSILKEAHAPSLKSVILSSDGLGTYQIDSKFVPPENTPIKDYSDLSIIPLIVSYKSIVGEFVVRRMQRMKADMEKEHVMHFDDVSCSSIVLK